MAELRKLPSGRIIEVPVLERAVYYNKLSLDKWRELFKEVVARANRRYGGINNLTSYCEFDEKNGWRGSTLGLTILTSEALGKELRIPALPEAMALHEAGMLNNNILVDYGAVLFSPQGSNSERVEEILKQAKDLPLPIILHPADLRLGKNGQTFELKRNAKYLISGEEAEALLAKISINKTGFRRLDRSRYGWNADWSGLFDSDEDCRVVDRVRGEAATTELLAEERKNIRQKYKEQQDQLITQMQALETERNKAIKSVSILLHRK